MSALMRAGARVAVCGVLSLAAIVCRVEAGQGSSTTRAPVTTNTAVEALQFLLDANISPGGPLTGDGATIAGVLAGQSLTFPISSSSGAYVTRKVSGFGPDIGVSSSGSFGPLFAERGMTNGRGNLSVSFGYQHKKWRSVSGIKLEGLNLTRRAVFRNAVAGRGPAGTVEESFADIDFETDVLIVAANYGVFSTLDVGISIPYVRASVDGVKRQTRTVPRGSPVLLAEQHVSGQSAGVGDAILRLKYRLPLHGGLPAIPSAATRYDRLPVSVGWDIRMPTGATTLLYLDCGAPPCPGGHTQEVPDVGLGVTTHKLSLIASTAFGRVSPHLNAGRVWVPSYACDARRFGNDGRCKGSIFELDPVNNTQDAKNQNLSDEWNVTAGFDYEMVPYRSTLSFDVIGRQLIRAGQFYQGPSRVIIRGNNSDPSVTTEVESRPGNVNTLLGVAGAKVGFRRRWVVVGAALFPLNAQGLQSGLTVVGGLERAFGS